MKRIITFLLAAVMLLACIPAAHAAGGYDNVTVAIASIQTDEDDDVYDEEEETAATGEENLSTTIRCETIGRRSHKLRNLVLLFVILVIAVVTYAYFTKDSNPTSQSIITTITLYWEKLSSYIK